jgi:hypothetical protein
MRAVAPRRAISTRHLLEMIYNGIKKDAGAEVASNFVRFVNKLDDLSASAFVVAFEQFAAKGGKVIDITQGDKDGIRVTGHGAARDAQAFAVIASALAGPKRTEGELRLAHYSVKHTFVQNHLKEIPAKERREMKALSFLG